MKMRELERLTGVNRETIRVYFRHGLLPAARRDKPNVADYDDAHVAAIRAIRGLQQEQGLTLPQIRSVLTGSAQSRAIDARAFPHLERLVAGRLDEFSALVPLDSVLPRNPQAHADARVLRAIGAIAPTRKDGHTMVTRTDAELVAIWGAMRGAGFTEALGFGPEILRFYVELADELAQREVGEFLRVVTGRLDDTRAAALALEAIQRMLPFFGLLRTKAVLKAIAADSGTRKTPRRRAR